MKITFVLFRDVAVSAHVGRQVAVVHDQLTFANVFVSYRVLELATNSIGSYNYDNDDGGEDDNFDTDDDDGEDGEAGEEDEDGENGEDGEDG